ncbi:MAG: hypothetical protein MRZ42_02250 [Tenericutes bacterium]|nr:hypothetical protein [Mycoplasmatota bacterium]
MFNKNSIIKEVNIINKLVCYLLILIALIICREPIFIVFVNLTLLIITRQYSKLFKTNLVIMFLSILSIFFPQILWITKIGILIIYTVLLKKVTQTVELRYVLESTLYRFQSKKITYKILYAIYFIKYFKKNIERMLVLKDDYSMPLNYKLIKFIIKHAYNKTKNQMEIFIEVNKLRFYNDSKNRTYIERKETWESWDTNYLIAHIIIMLLTVFYGR